MSSTLAIARRDFTSFFVTKRGYVLLGLVVALWGFYFFNALGRFNFIASRASGMQLNVDINAPTLQQFVIEPYFQLVLFSFVVLMPLLAMRSLAEERQQGTFELLSTSPGSVWGLVFGKFFALAALSICFSAIASVFPLSLVFFGTPDVGLITSGCLAVSFAGIAFSAIALACGARTERQLSAGITGLFVLGLLLMLHIPAAVLGADARVILELLSSYSEAAAFFDGYFSLQGVVYFFGLAAIGIFITHFSLQLSRNTNVVDSGRRWLTPVSAAGVGALLFVIGQLVGFALSDPAHPLALGHSILGGVAIAIALIRLGSTSFRVLAPFLFRLSAVVILFCIAERSALFIDLSDVRRYTVSEHTRAVVKNSKAPVEIRYVLRGNDRIDARAMRYLRDIVSIAPEVYTLKIIDPADYPSISSSFGIEAGDVVQFLTTLPSETQTSEPQARRLNLKEFHEAAISSALQTLTSTTKQRVYVLEAGGGARLFDTGPTGLSKFGYAMEFEGLSPAVIPYDANDIPQDANLVALIGPREPLSLELSSNLASYVERGGKLLIAIDPLFAAPYQEFLARFDVQVKDAVVIDSEQVRFSQGRAGLQPLIRDLAEHPITNRLGSAQAVVMNIVAPLLAADSGAPGGASVHEVEGLLFASAGSVADDDVLGILNGRKTYSEALQSASSSDPEPVAVAAAITNRQGAPQVVVFGDSDWILNAGFDYYSNRDLALNAGQWLIGNTWALVQRIRTAYSATVALSPQMYAWLMVSTILCAEFLILFGLIGVRIRETKAAGR